MKPPNSGFLGFAAISVAACIVAMPAKASQMFDGVTYSLTELLLSPTEAQFTLGITGINGPSDTEGGRYGVQAFAFNQPSNFVSATAPAGFTETNTGLNSSSSTGCNTSPANFYCFSANTTPTAPPLAANSSLSFVFDVTTSAAGSFSGYGTTTDDGFKIDWVGTNNNYDLISQNLTPTVVPLPAAVWLLLSGIGGLGLFARRRVVSLSA